MKQARSGRRGLEGTRTGLANLRAVSRDTTRAVTWVGAAAVARELAPELALQRRRRLLVCYGAAASSARAVLHQSAPDGLPCGRAQAGRRQRTRTLACASQQPAMSSPIEHARSGGSASRRADGLDEGGGRGRSSGAKACRNL